MKLLVIGGTGVLSSAVVAEALKNNIEVTVINRGRSGRQSPEDVHQIIADYRDTDYMQTILKDLHFDAVIDFICYTPAQIEYSVNLLHSISNQYIFISTTCVYNSEILGIKKEDSEKVLKSWNYSVNKWKCEEFLLKKSKDLVFNYTIIRPCVTYDDTRIPYGIMPEYGYHWTFIARIINGKPILRWDGGDTRWNMMRVEDFAVGVVGLIGNPLAYGEAFNLSGDTAYSWNDVLKSIEFEIGVSPVIIDISSEEYMKAYPGRQGEIIGRSLDLIVDNSKIKNVVPSYATKISLRDGIKKTINAYINQNYQKGIDYAFDGDTDRIISTILRNRKSNKDSRKLKFINYLGKCSFIDRVTYISHRYNSYFLSLIIKIIRCIK